MEPVTSPRKPLKSPENPTANLNVRTSITCINVPEGLFDTTAAKKHFSKFGRAQKIRLFPKKQMCIVEYDQPSSVDRAVLNAGAFDGFMFDVIRTKNRVRRKSKKDDDPDWVPDSDVEEELSAMSGAPIYRVSRQKPIPIDTELKINPIKRVVKQQVIRHKTPVRDKTKISQPTSGIESPVIVPTAQSTISTSEAAAELNQLRSRTSVTPDEQWRTLDARDRILRAWGGAGSRVKIGGATIGTCPDMCPEKELLHRQSEHQVMTLETVPDSDGQLEPWRAVKQYSRSSADQEIPMCYELRPPQVLMRTTAYLLHEIADTTRQVSLADWFHFMWDRFRGIRKDITQQALCCAESIWLVEICARFHAHCAARLADLEHTQFDQKLNTDNLTKCLQTLKHMYTDVTPDQKPREAEFRGYIALLNLGDANFWWEIKQLPLEIQKSEAITFAIKIFNALDNNNYVRFFRLIKEQATYLQACILLRYFNDVRARALARIVKAFAPRGGSRYPAEELMNSLAFESSESMRSFINHYGLRFGKDESDLIVILDRNQFIEDSDPYPLARSIKLIESKRQNTVGELIAGGSIPNYDYANHSLYTSFTKEGKLKESALIAEEQGYNTINDSNKDLQALKAEIKRLSKGGRNYGNVERESKSNLIVKAETKPANSAKSDTFVAPINNTRKNQFSFKPAIPVAPIEVIKLSPEKVSIGDMKNIFSFSKPQETYESNLIANDIGGPFKTNKHVFGSKTSLESENKDPSPNSQLLFRTPDYSTVFKKPEIGKNIFGQTGNEIKNTDSNKNVFGNVTSTVFGKNDDEYGAGQNAFSTNIFTKIASSKSNNSRATPDNIFAKASAGQENEPKQPGNIFGSFGKPNVFAEAKHIFALPENTDSQTQPIFAPNGDASNQLSPGTFFKSAVNSDGKPYSIFQSKNKAQTVAENIFNSVNASMPNNIVYEFDPSDDTENQDQLQQQHEEKLKEEMERKLKEEEQKRQELIRLEKEKRNEEQRRKLLEIKKLEEQRKKEEERKQEELRKKLEEERKAEMKRKAEESERKFKERVEKESTELIEELVNEVRDETLREILSEEVEKMKKLMSYAGEVTEETWMELCDEICRAEMKVEKFRTEKLMKKWFYVWRQQLLRNFKRRYLLEDTPVWLTDKTPVEEATYLKRPVENDALKSMNAIHRGYKFTGEVRLPPAPEPYNIMEIIKSPLLKRMKQINYPYDKCFFWKLTVVSPGDTTWLCRKIEIEKWILDVFGDKKKHEMSDSLIRVEKQSWNHLMDFAISVSLTNKTSKLCSEAVEATNGLLFYTTEHDSNFIDTLQETLKHKYPYQVIPIVVIMPEMNNDSTYKDIQQILTDYANKNMISGFKICVLDSQNVFDSLNVYTKSALKWIAKRYPRIPPLETDYLKSICQRYLGNEIWYRLKSEADGRVNMILKDLPKLVQCYNTAVDKLTESITNEDLFNHPPFPLEFNQYLDHSSPYPKPYEFIATNTRNSDNTHAIKDMMKKLKLPDPVSEFQPLSVVTLQDQIRKYCNQLEWFENPEQVVCKVVAVFPNQFSNLDMSHKHFSEYFEHYDLTDFLNIMVYEKINRLNNFDNRFAIYEKTALEDYKNTHWLYEIEILSRMKHKALEYEDELDMFIEAKRRKIAIDSMEYLMLEDKDSTMVEENIKFNDEKISKYTNCEKAVKQLEEQIDLERQKSMQLENLLKSALSNV